MYAGLLGLSVPEGGAGTPAEPKPMHIAMRDPRLATAATSRGARTRSAYQHHGKRYFRFFGPVGTPRG